MVGEVRWIGPYIQVEPKVEDQLRGALVDIAAIAKRTDLGDPRKRMELMADLAKLALESTECSRSSASSSSS